MSDEISVKADATPKASALIESLRDIGYSLSTALADIIDNSITAKASHIQIFADTVADNPSIAIVDNGTGMNKEQLIEALRLGSKTPLDTRSSEDLGRFGLGLKSASFSQCRRLTVKTCQDGVTAAARWDLDDVANSNRWEISILNDPGDVYFSEKLTGNGTLVLWEKLDRIDGGYTNNNAKRTQNINSALAQAERHLSIVFHRFMERRGPGGLSISINGRSLKPVDPFAQHHPATQVDPEETISLEQGLVRVRSFTIPHHKAMQKDEWEKLGGPEGHLRSQGFYIYRGNRLIISGSWLGLARQKELTKLCRIRVDIPNTMDSDWKIDVKKASAQLPPVVRERLKRIIERFVQTSKRTYIRRGQKLTDETRLPLWQRVMNDGMIFYQPNTEHPAIVELTEQMPENLKTKFNNCIKLIGAGLPLEALHADMMGSTGTLQTEEVDLDTLEQAIKSIVPHLINQGMSEKTISSMLKSTEMFSKNWEKVEPLFKTILAQDNSK